MSISASSSTIKNGPGWVESVVFHGGSKPGADLAFIQSVQRVCGSLRGAGVHKLYFGGGRSGLMGHAANSAVRANLDVQGISLPFFTAAQGEELEGVEPTIIAQSMRDRKVEMRQRGQLSVVIGGGNGTLEEMFEWSVSRNGIIKPVVALDHNGFFSGLQRYNRALIEAGFATEDLNRRMYFEDDPDAMLGRVRDLNAHPPEPEPEHATTRLEVLSYIQEKPNAVIVHPGPAKVMEVMLERFVSYDVSNLNNVTTHDSLYRDGRWGIFGQEVYLPDAVLKPAIFVGSLYDGIKEQFMRGIEEQFIAADRAHFYNFVSTPEEAEDLASELRALTPAELQAKHAEAPTYAVGP